MTESESGVLPLHYTSVFSYMLSQHAKNYNTKHLLMQVLFLHFCYFFHLSVLKLFYGKIHLNIRIKIVYHRLQI